MSMTMEQKRRLEPFANILAEWDQQIINMNNDDLYTLKKAVKAASTTNCWACTYAAAQVLLPMIERSITHRNAARMKTLKTAER